MTKLKKPFKMKAVNDNIIVYRHNIKTKIQKRAERSNIVQVEGPMPRGIADIEKRKAEKLSSYEDAENKVLKEWDEHPNQGTVMAVGPQSKSGVKVGDHILFRGSTGDPLIVDKQLYFVIRDYDIFVIDPTK